LFLDNPINIYGKRDKILLIRTYEHANSDEEKAIYKHLQTTEHVIFIRNLCNMPDTPNGDFHMYRMGMSGEIIQPIFACFKTDKQVWTTMTALLAIFRV